MEKELQIQSNTLVYYDFQFKDKTIDINWASLENVQFLKMRNIQNEISKMYIAAQNLIKKHHVNFDSYPIEIYLSYQWNIDP